MGFELKARVVATLSINDIYIYIYSLDEGENLHFEIENVHMSSEHYEEIGYGNHLA